MSDVGLASVYVADAASSFKMMCLGLLDTAYAEVYEAKVVNCEWDENAVSEVLVGRINDNPFAISKHITAITEKRLLPCDLQNALKKVDSTYRIDIKIGGFGWSSNEYRTECFMEAKNLYCQNFKKTDHKGWTSSTQYVKRYIETGVDNLLKGHYPIDTILLGYVLIGTVQGAVDLLNQCFGKASRNTEKIELLKFKEFPHLELGFSNHPQEITVGHCFLMF